MISPKKLIKMARKWQRKAMIRQRGIALLGIIRNSDEASLSVVSKGHFVVYTADQRRFVIPLVYLKSEIFRELLKLAEEEYGLQINKPIMLPCDAVFMEYAVSLVLRNPAKDLERTLSISVAKSAHCIASSYYQQETTQKIPIHGF
ncbi:Auxin-responsive protein SAUR66 [Heracleum sosnowskyi]|uniref:Auxin-responsive protein SAUR66 n=1 Tax=Heracleum sosnowskyi TaxID=360622 RepID=A0AAD8MF33_9APIA|nr:Auxin-responsive protein SAUR66 [Heracleum sosnowskyi]